MRVVILAGGSGTRLSEETIIRPKPMVEIGTKPILWHIMSGYATHGFKDFAVALGYKGDYIKRYFADYAHLSSDLSIDLSAGTIERIETGDGGGLDWRVHLVDTGEDVGTGGRVKRLSHLLDERFMLTYGDGVTDLDVGALLEFHERSGRMVTLTAVRPPARFGVLEIEGDRVSVFEEKPQVSEGWINGGFMVWEPEALDYIDGDDAYVQDTLEILARKGEVSAYLHDGFWQCMDTMRDKVYLQKLWDSGNAPWKTWSQQ
jgi:glucose-1-phosphate cytidylyltransferase